MKVPTFSAYFYGKAGISGGDVTRPERMLPGIYAWIYSLPAAKKGQGQRSEISVDNSKFSTLSTGFSTMVIHSGKGAVDIHIRFT